MSFLSTDPENYNPDTDKFEYFIGVGVCSTKELPKDMVYREFPKNEYICNLPLRDLLKMLLKFIITYIQL